MAAEITRMVGERFPQQCSTVRIGALMFAAGSLIAEEKGYWRDKRARMEHFGRMFDEIVLMHLSKDGYADRSADETRPGAAQRMPEQSSQRSR